MSQQGVMKVEEASIRFAALADADALKPFHNLSAEAARFAVERQEIVVAELEGELIGYARLEYLWARVPFLALIRVPSSHQRRGIGRALLAYLEEFLRERGHDALYSSSMADEPDPQAWHRRMGFAECGFIAGINEGGVGEVFFRKMLR